MSEHDDTLLDEDLGDEEYDLGNDEEEALLADDYELDRQNSYKGEEETDDVLDLGVTDALDDLEENEEENIEFSKDKTDNHNESDFYNDGINQEDKSAYYEQNEVHKYQNEQNQQYEEDANIPNNLGKGDLREKLQKKNYVGNGQGLEDDDGEEARERRNRFQSERVMISPKMNNEIPDSLENVVTCESSRIPLFRNRGRGRGMRGGRGGRFNTQNSGNYNVRFAGPRGPLFENQQPQFRPPLLENRPPYMLGVPNNGQNQQMVFQQPGHQIPAHQQFPPNGPLQGPGHFVENRPPFNPNQFQGPAGPPGPRPVNPRMEYGSWGPIQGPLMGPPCNNPHPPQYPQMQPGPFQNPGGLLQDNQARPGPMQGAPGPHLHANPSGSLLGNPQISGNAVPMIPGNQAHPIQGFPPRHQTAAQGPVMTNHPNASIPGQPSFENRPPFQEPLFEGRPYEQRPPYVDQVPNNQFSNNALPAPQQPASNVPNVPLPPGHKILINPHFRGAVQPAAEARLAWDMAHQASTQSQVGSSQFLSAPASYQNQGSYNQNQQSSGNYQQQNYQQSKSDDPYSYFSDMWQENKSQKSQSSPTKQYPSESNFSRDSSYNSSSKYKSDGPWERSSYQEDHKGHQNYRDRDAPPRSRNDHVSKTGGSSTYRNDSYEQSHSQRPSGRSISSNARPANKPAAKRVSSEFHDSSQHETSPKRAKTNSRNLQEVKRTDSVSNSAEDKKDEDSDPEMREYRRKMEEQKRLREKILREKEDRRKKAALEKQSEETKVESDTTVGSTQQESKPVLMHSGVTKDVAANKSHPALSRGRGRPTSAQVTESTDRQPGGRIIRAIPTSYSNESSNSGNADESNAGNTMNQISDSVQLKSSIGPTGTRRVVIQKSSNVQKVPTTIHRAVSNIQKGQSSARTKGNAQDALQKVVQSPHGTLKRSVVNNQRVAQKSQTGLQKTMINVQSVANANAQKVIVNTQNNQRVVLQKSPVQAKKALEMKTNTVKLENLAASTSEAQIRRMCQGIGTIESIHMGEGTATIVFKTQSAAMVFHKKYQRKMLDLSLITVRLLPQAGGNKTTTAIT